MEYLFYCHSDLYAGAKGQRCIGGRKTTAHHSCSLGGMVKDEQRQQGRFNHGSLNANSKSLWWLIQYCVVVGNGPSHLKISPFYCLSLQVRRGVERGKYWMRNKTSEGKRALLGIHLSLWIDKGNLGWFLPVGLLADRRGEGSATAELQGAGIT